MASVVLVDQYDNPIGTMEKMQAHREGRLHRAISVLIFNSDGEWLLQQRAPGKYHSPLLWTNTCCSHPTPEELTENAAKRRLMEEMGIKTDLQFLFSFQYRAEFDNGLTEHELDHVYVGYSDQPPQLNPDEVKAYKYVLTSGLFENIKQHPGNYTEWFKLLFPRVCKKLSVA